ncbi:hypothetical protein ACRALDRAFT_205952 [Sodiomyces alcalophilus JCM 7366]|uniref:uncharacterized protein n=1 Tax=Sodiomyces alcalophilus JCM 7366 TaxID=591952 RepID=UPI0039B574A9
MAGYSKSIARLSSCRQSILASYVTSLRAILLRLQRMTDMLVGNGSSEMSKRRQWGDNRLAFNQREEPTTRCFGKGSPDSPELRTVAVAPFTPIGDWFLEVAGQISIIPLPPTLPSTLLSTAMHQARSAVRKTPVPRKHRLESVLKVEKALPNPTVSRRASFGISSRRPTGERHALAAIPRRDGRQPKGMTADMLSLQAVCNVCDSSESACQEEGTGQEKSPERTKKQNTLPPRKASWAEIPPPSPETPFHIYKPFPEIRQSQTPTETENSKPFSMRL